MCCSRARRPPAQVCVIGAGFAGLAVCRALSRRDVGFTCVDRSTSVGGVWHWPQDPRSTPTPAYAALRLNTSRERTAFTGFPMPRDYPAHPDLARVAAYLRAFSAAHGIGARVEAGTEVVGFAPGSGGWTVTTRGRDGERSRRYTHVVVATGHHWTPRLPSAALSGQGVFQGRVLHSLDYWDAEVFTGRRVLVVGFGNTACDIAVDVSRVADRTLLSVRGGAHVLPKRIAGTPVDALAGSRLWRALPVAARRSLLRPFLGDTARHRLPVPSEPFLSSPVVINDHLMACLAAGRVAPRPTVTGWEPRRVLFADGRTEEVDAVIHCTGYRLSTPFLPSGVLGPPAGPARLYMRVVPPHHPGLYFAGFLRGTSPPVSTLLPLFEEQAEWIAELVEGSCRPPSTEVMEAEVGTHLGGPLDQPAPRGGGDGLHVPLEGYRGRLRRERIIGSGAVRPTA
jgi:dimethylaniline monooxygenase (N-oxide forming)